MIRFIGTLLQLQSIMTAHSQWLSPTRSSPYWTTSYSSIATSHEWRITVHTFNFRERQIHSDEWFTTFFFITSNRPKCRTVPLLSCSLSRESVFSDLLLSNDSFIVIRCSGNLCLPKRYLANAHIPSQYKYLQRTQKGRMFIPLIYVYSDDTSAPRTTERRMINWLVINKLENI
jgi:hypothetical protein